MYIIHERVRHNYMVMHTVVFTLRIAAFRWFAHQVYFLTIGRILWLHICHWLISVNKWYIEEIKSDCINVEHHKTLCISYMIDYKTVVICAFIFNLPGIRKSSETLHVDARYVYPSPVVSNLVWQNLSSYHICWCPFSPIHPLMIVWMKPTILLH